MNGLRPIERVNPAVRLVCAVLVGLGLVVSVDWVSATVGLVLELVVLLAAGVRPGWLARRLAPLFLLAPLGAVSMLLYGEVGGRVLWHWGPATISEHSCWLALAMFVRVFALATPAVALLGGMDATRLADGLAQVLRLPARFVLGTLAAFRMLGLLQADWRAIEQARRARGLGDAGRLRRWATMSFALLVVAIRRGTRLATAMEARGFGAPGVVRSWARPSRVGMADAVATGISIAIGVLAVGAAVRAGTLWTVFS
ncbi:energy-coupling factor transporter transmembrane component T [Luteococcus sanguinis]|uniref:Energy-coupling factor transporter transmembrane component T family protein n=1 Tax=Luteococcus sanguinis TaxID=174038 RepID=A0ABW1WYU5_9ACTN